MSKAEVAVEEQDVRVEGVEETDVKIYRTMEFEKFSFHPRNREIKPRLVEKLKTSIAEKNKLDRMPITVSPDFLVWDGQHRLRAAEKLGVPIYFMFDEEMTIEDVALLNSNQETWTMEDYLHFYEKGGNEHYQELRRFWDRNNHLSLSYAAELLSTRIEEKDGEGREFTQHRSLRGFREGAFRVGNADYAQTVADRILDFIEMGYEMRNPKTFCRAVERISRSPNYSHATMLDKVERTGELTWQPSVQEYLLHFERIYNWRAQDRTQLF